MGPRAPGAIKARWAQAHIAQRDGHEGRGELLLRHHFEGRELDLSEAGEVLKHLARLWRRPVHLLTTEREQTRLVTSDGEELQAVDVSDDESSQAA